MKAMFWSGFIVGLFVGLFWLSVYTFITRPPPAEELQRRYDAYRNCIPEPWCMTAQDYIDYYDLRWQLEKDQ